MASPAPWLRWTQTELTRWHGQEEEEEEEEEEDDFERRMDEDGVIGLGEGARSPPWGGSEELEEGSPTEEGRWHPRQEPAEEDEERGSSGGDEGPWGAESDGDPYPELSSGGCWGSGSSGSPEAMRDGRALCQPRGCSTDGGDTSGLSDTSPSPGTPSRQHRGWGTAGDTIGGHREEWSPRRSLPQQFSTDGPSPECVPEPQTAGTGMAPAGSAPTGQPQGAGSAPAPRGHGRSRVPKKAAPTVVPPKPARQSRSLSPRRRTGAKGTKDPSRTGTEGTQYGRGRLNHPLPDLSKVEARVKFDQSYRPPRGRVLPARPRGPIGFKSPAEIVREVLLSSGEGASPQPPSTAGLPQEFRSPRQATALVQQLQDDYHKLLTKYAEAENTIDQLRLGARVSLFSDPPQPSRSLAVGTVATGSRVMTLSIPQARTAALCMATAPAPPGAAAAPGPSERGGSPQPRSPPPPGGGCPTCPGPCCCPGPRLTRALAGQSRRLQAQVESFESWVRSGTPTASEQLQRMRMLKDAQDALEREYLRGRQQLPAAAGEFDPDRAVEGEIYRLGLRLEGLKERLEPGGRRQPLPQPLPQPCCPPAPSPPPAAHSPRPESPALVEDPRGTAGDSEGVAGGLPWPLWHKQCQVEEDFRDLLEQYKHFKSLPESLSLERLSLAESRSQEEVDAPMAGEGGPSKVPYRTRSLEEEPNLEPLALHLPQRRAVTLPPRGPPNLEDTRGHHSPATAEEPPASAKPTLGVPEPPRVPLSLGGPGSSATQHGPHKEQRIVSPETDSGFVGSEASRVSPPVHTPEHHPPGPGAPGSLGPSVPIPSSLRSPRKRETTPLPSETALMGIYPPGGTGGPRLPPSSLSQSSSPPRWAEGSEVGPDPDGDGTHTDSEVGDRSCASANGHPAAMARNPTSPLPSPETPSPTLLSPDLPSLDLAHCDLLGSRLERDQAIRALQDEVWWLRRRLEESLLRSRSHPEGKGTPRVTLARRQPVASAPSAPQDAAPSGEPSPPVQGRAAAGVTPMRRERSASLPRGKPELDLGKWDPTRVGTEGTRSSLHATCPAQAQQDVVGLQDCGDQVLVLPRTPQCSAQGGSCRSGAGSQRMPPPFPVLCHSLRVRARAPGTPGPSEAPWEAPGGSGIPGTVHRDTVPGGDTACHPGTPRRAEHLGVSPMSQGQDGIRCIWGRCPSPAAPAQHPQENVLPHLPGTHRQQGHSHSRRACPWWLRSPRSPCWSQEAGATWNLVLGSHPCCHRLPGTRPPRALRALHALLLPSSSYLSPSPGRGPPWCPCGSPAGRASPPAPGPPALPEPGAGGAGGAALVPGPGGGGCPERQAEQQPPEPGPGRRAGPAAGPARLLPLLRALLAPPEPLCHQRGERAPHGPCTACPLPDLGPAGPEVPPEPLCHQRGEWAPHGPCTACSLPDLGPEVPPDPPCHQRGGWVPQCPSTVCPLPDLGPAGPEVPPEPPCHQERRMGPSWSLSCMPPARPGDSRARGASRASMPPGEEDGPLMVPALCAPCQTWEHRGWRYLQGVLPWLPLPSCPPCSPCMACPSVCPSPGCPKLQEGGRQRSPAFPIPWDQRGVPPGPWPSHPKHFWGCSDLMWVDPPWQLCLPLCLCGQNSLAFPGIPYSTPFQPPGLLRGLCPVAPALGLEPSRILPGGIYFLLIFM